MKQTKYTYDNLVHSRHFAEHIWAAKIALDPSKKYSLKEADRIVNAFLKKEVKN